MAVLGGLRLSDPCGRIYGALFPVCAQTHGNRRGQINFTGKQGRCAHDELAECRKIADVACVLYVKLS